MHVKPSSLATVFGPKIWNQLPIEIKKETSLLRFKDYIKLHSWSYLSKYNETNNRDSVKIIDWTIIKNE